MTLAATQTRPVAIDRSVIRVLHVRTVAGNGGGPERTIFRGAAHLPALGIHAEALFLLDARTPGDRLAAQAAGADMPVHLVTERSALDPAGAAAFARLVRGGRFNVVHTHDYKSNAVARALTAAGQYRIVATTHGYNQTTRREGYYYALERLILRRADAVICPSADLADHLAGSGVSRRRLHVIPNAIELDRWPFRPDRPRGGTIRLLYAGRLSAEKNVADLLTACAVLAGAGRDVRLRVAGEGPMGPDLAEEARALGLDGRVEWLGLRGDVAALHAEANVLVNPSLTEGMPNTVLEALACGTAVVATDVGATRELILHERTGLLVPPGNPEALATAIAHLADRPDVARALAARGRQHVERHFDFATRVAHVVALYRGVLAAAERTR